jgi:hypothetical protein
MATKYHPLPLLEVLINHMGINRYFVIFSPIQEVKNFKR